MAASAPIQFTVDQEALLVADTNVARERPAKKRPSTGYITQSPGPQPMYAKRSNIISGAPNGIPTPTTTPPPASENKKFDAAAVVKAPAFKADIPEGESPKSLATEPAALPSKVSLPEAAVKQEEDSKKESDERENDIYAEAALQCSIDNREECLMCSG